jgi:hypothetical protein
MWVSRGKRKEWREGILVLEKNLFLKGHLTNKTNPNIPPNLFT